MTLWCNGQWTNVADFSVSPFDRASLLGLGLFETILARDGEPVFLQRHLARLQRNAERLSWTLDFPDAAGVMAGLLRRNSRIDGRARIRLAMTAGSGPVRDLAPGRDSLLWMMALAVDEAPARGAVNLSPWVRNERSPLAGLKCASYAENVIALDHARRLGFSETLFFNTVGHLCEAATANVFLVRGGKLFTPPLASGCLAGVTREVLIELAGKLGIPCDQCSLTKCDLDGADEVFLSSSIRGVMGVSRIVDRELPADSMTRLLAEAWARA